jgi:hypothetical protein
MARCGVLFRSLTLVGDPVLGHPLIGDRLVRGTSVDDTVRGRRLPVMRVRNVTRRWNVTGVWNGCRLWNLMRV